MNLCSKRSIELLGAIQRLFPALTILGIDLGDDLWDARKDPGLDESVVGSRLGG